MLDLTISIVSYNTKTLLQQCLKSIIENTRGIRYEVIVVDNGSVDRSADMVEQEFPQVRLIRNSENVFFARAHNQARDLAVGEYICILNSDTVIQRDAFRLLVQKIRQRSEVGAIGCLMVSDLNKTQESIYRKVSLMNMLSLSKYLSRLLKYFLLTRSYPLASYYTEGFVEVLQDSLIIMPTRFMRERGIYDDSLKLYSTEDQIAEEVSRSGLKLLYTPAVRAVHLLSRSTLPKSNTRFIYRVARDDAYVFHRRYRGPIRAAIVYVLFSLDLFLVGLVSRIRGVS